MNMIDPEERVKLDDKTDVHHHDSTINVIVY